MGHLIRHGQIVDGDTGELVSLEAFLDQPELKNPGWQGVWLDAHEEVEQLVGYLEEIPVIGLNFPAFSDGRAYSSAAILRGNYRYEGEIRAIGDVRIDQLEQMARCGFDAFELAEGQNTNRALEKLTGFPYSYQHTVDREPLFRKRGSDSEVDS